MSTKFPYEIRAESIIQNGLELAMKIGYSEISREKLAKHMKVSPALISYYYGWEELKDLVLRLAKRKKVLSQIVKGF